jgi:uncharacterized membrane protein
MAKKKRGKKTSLGDINKKLDALLTGQKKILKEEKEIEREEKEVLEEEGKELAEEKKVEGETEEELSELKKLERLEREIEKQTETHPLMKVTYKDVARGAVGAFFGSVAHYTFLYGIEVAEQLNTVRASFLYLLSFAIGAVFIYITGFRKIKDIKVLAFLPIRLIVLYVTSILMAILVLYFFYPDFGNSFVLSFKQVATVTLTAILGACTADLIGKD